MIPSIQMKACDPIIQKIYNEAESEAEICSFPEAMGLIKTKTVDDCEIYFPVHGHSYQELEKFKAEIEEILNEQ